MAVEVAKEHRTAPQGLSLTIIYGLGLVAIFVGERLLSETSRTVADGLGLALSGGALMVRLVNRSRVAAAAGRVESIISALYASGLLSVVLYAFTLPWATAWLGGEETAARIQPVLSALWPAVLVCSLVPLGFVEASYATMPIAEAVEIRRIWLSLASGLTIALSLVTAIAINYTVAEFEVRRDLSYFKRAVPSEATIKMVRRLDEPLQVVLFYPRSNEVLDQVRPYFEELRRASKNIQIKQVDQVLAPRLAKEHQVRGNGYVLLLRGEHGESFQVGLELEKARRRLKRLDHTFQERFSEVTQPERIFYTVVGHGERTNRSRDQGEGDGIEDLTTFVRRFGLRHRNLGLAQGLASRVPEDATVVALAGPTESLLPEEVDSLVRYVRGGGRLLLMLEPGASPGLEPLLDQLGLRLGEGVLAHEQLYRLLTDTTADRSAIITNRYSAHPSVSTVMRAERGVATVFYRAGYLTKRPGTSARVNFTIRSVSGTWADLDGNLRYDPGQEHRMTYSIAAAVTLPPAQREESGDDQNEGGEARAVVIADADVFSDKVFRNRGNFLLAADTIAWLSGYEGGAGEMEDEEDPEIQHTRGQDALWFWSTVVLIPLGLLVGGLLFTSRRRRRQRRRSS